MTAPRGDQRRSGTAATIGAVVAVVVLVALAVLVVLVGMFLPMAAAGCGTGNVVDEPLICGPVGQLVVLTAPVGGAALGVLVALAGFVPFPLRHRRAIFIGVGYLLTLGGLGLGFLVSFTG
ncbi:hypothetical protein AWW66_08965 [Micromonospora rosaria]|uniref:Uncharacterized protein n=1 Tax=Micromonospora rosaria TaxID=47874 RepID=A0A136PVI0_9ACTN|nr:hypothetical protein [Micromonospora rosaria]KXK62347.1 hypothetical protein AWW66_08965 [Micromonospora rosaria]